MTIRPLPKIDVSAPRAEISFDIAPQALASWDSSVAAAQGSDDTISIFDPIGENWDGTGITAKSVASQLAAIGQKPVTVLINCPGGNFFEGLAIYNLLRAHPFEVTVQVVGIAASAASIIAMAGDSIEIARAGLIMIHNVQWVAIGDRHAMQDAHDTMVTFDEALTGLYVDRTEQPADELAKMMDATTFLSSAKALEMGFADELLEADRVTTSVRASSEMQPAYKIEAALARGGLPRAERRRLLKDIIGKPSAAGDNDMPGAVDFAADDGTTGLSIALARLKLTRA
jgi:ATP-dependent protease ClpP protease subunit